MTAILAALLLTACQSEDIPNQLTDVPGSESGLHVRMSVQDFVWEADTPTTRTTCELDGGIVFKWAEGDIVGIFGETGDPVSFPIADGAGTSSAEFDGGPWALKAGYKYSAYYPHSRTNYDRTAIPIAYKELTQTGNNAVAHLAANDYITSSMTAPNQGIVCFQFEHIAAAVRLTLTVPEPDTYTKFKLSTPTAIIPQTQTLNLLTNTLTTQKAIREILMPLQGITTTTPNEQITLYLLLPAINLTGTQLTATLDGIDHRCDATFGGKKLERGKGYSFSLTMQRIVTGGEFNGHEYVDLALPSGTLWATCNVGASSPEEAGGYFLWGEVEDHANDGFNCYRDNTANIPAYNKDLAALRSMGYLPEDGTKLTPLHDAARHHWGGTWRTPTLAEAQELYLGANCTQETITRNGVKGKLFTSKRNGNSLFLPFHGERYWTTIQKDGQEGAFLVSTVLADKSTHVHTLYLYDTSAYILDYYRYMAYNVRAVTSPAEE